MYQGTFQYVYDTQSLHRTRIPALTINRSGWGVRLNSVDLSTYKVFFEVAWLSNSWWEGFLLRLKLLTRISPSYGICLSIAFAIPVSLLFLCLIYCVWPMEHHKRWSEADTAPYDQPRDQPPPPYEAVPRDLAEAQGISVNGMYTTRF